MGRGHRTTPRRETDVASYPCRDHVATAPGLPSGRRPSHQRNYGNRMTTVSDASIREPAAMRAAMVSSLRDQGAITSESVAAAFAAVPRHRFAPDATLEASYAPNGTVVAKRDQ